METANEKLSDEKSETYKVSKVSMETGKSQAFEYTYQRGLPPTVSDKLIDRIVQKLPDWLSGIFMNRERSVLLVERKIQRKFLSEYRAQIKSLDPLLRERGRILGKSVIQAFAGHHAARFNYNDIESQSREMLFFQQQNVQEVIRTLDPLIQPVCLFYLTTKETCAFM